MNLLEQYIEEIYAEEIYSVEDAEELFKKRVGYHICKPVVYVSMRVNCYGIEEDAEKIFYVDEWEEIKKKGYYMA